MFQADLDFQYGLIKEGDLKLVAFGGLNTTAILSKYEMLVDVGQNFANDSGLKFGANIGACVEMYVDRYYDAFLSVKYIAGSWDQFVISIGVMYNIDGARGRGW